MLHVNERPRGKVMVLALAGNIAAGDADTTFGDRIRRVLSRGYRKLLLDLSAATSSDATVISAFLNALSDAHTVNAEIKLVHVTRHLSNLMIIVALHRYFSVFDSEDDALASFGADAATPLAARGATRLRLEPATTS